MTKNKTKLDPLTQKKTLKPPCVTKTNFPHYAERSFLLKRTFRILRKVRFGSEFLYAKALFSQREVSDVRL